MENSIETFFNYKMCKKLGSKICDNYMKQTEKVNWFSRLPLSTWNPIFIYSPEDKNSIHEAKTFMDHFFFIFFNDIENCFSFRISLSHSLSHSLDNIEVIKGILKHGHWRVNEDIFKKTSTLIEIEIKISLLKCCVRH